MNRDKALYFYAFFNDQIHHKVLVKSFSLVVLHRSLEQSEACAGSGFYRLRTTFFSSYRRVTAFTSATPGQPPLFHLSSFREVAFSNKVFNNICSHSRRHRGCRYQRWSGYLGYLRNNYRCWTAFCCYRVRTHWVALEIGVLLPNQD